MDATTPKKVGIMILEKWSWSFDHFLTSHLGMVHQRIDEASLEVEDSK